jgi:hypothetical protein
MMMDFKVGDHVCWTSQAGGVKAMKHGDVVEIVPSGKRPLIPGAGSQRNHTSYMVVGDIVGCKRKKKYWPLARFLEPCSCGQSDNNVLHRQSLQSAALELVERLATNAGWHTTMTVSACEYLEKWVRHLERFEWVTETTPLITPGASDKMIEKMREASKSFEEYRVQIKR